MIARVRMAETTSSELPRTQLVGISGSNSQIEAGVSMFMILVTWDMTSVIARLMTCARHGR